LLLFCVVYWFFYCFYFNVSVLILCFLFFLNLFVFLQALIFL